MSARGPRGGGVVVVRAATRLAATITATTALWLAASPAPAWGQRQPRSTSADGDHEAGAALDRGLDALAQGRFADAAAALERAYGLRPQPVTLYDLALAYRGAGRNAAAIGAFERYLSAPEPGAEAERLRTVRETVARLRQRVGSIVVAAEPAGAAVAIDGATRVASEGDEVILDPGEHVVEARAAGYRTLRRRVQLAAAEHRTVTIALTPTSADARGTTSALRPLSAGPFVVMGAGALSLGFAAVAYFVVSADAQRELRSYCPGGGTSGCDPGARYLYDRAIGFATAAVVADVVGGVGLAGGLLWLLLDVRARSAVASPRNGAVAAALRAGPGSLAVRLEF